MINLLHASSEARSDQTTLVPVSVSYVRAGQLTGSAEVQNVSSRSFTADLTTSARLGCQKGQMGLTPPAPTPDQLTKTNGYIG